MNFDSNPFPRFPRTGDAGTVLVTSLLLTMLLFGIAGAYVLLSVGGFENSARELATVEARSAAEDGLHLSLAELKSGVDADGDGLANVSATAADGRAISVTATNLGGNLYRLHSSVTLRRARKAADVVVERIPLGLPQAHFNAAIAAKGPVTASGSIVIDGRDWNDLGTAVVGSGIYGLSSMGVITTGGNSKIGGNGIAPAKPPPPGTTEAFATWADATDNDADGTLDEEAFDGVDNDGDGFVDEDTHGFPTSPDVALHFAPNTLKNAAIGSNTYFTSPAQVAACIAGNGGRLPGGKIIFCDFSAWLPVNLGSAFNSPPSILVYHNATSTALMTNVTGCFRGLILTDSVQHFNGTFALIGGLLSFADQAIGNAFGLGNASIKYSSAVLANLPAAGTVGAVRIKSWCRSSAQ